MFSSDNIDVSGYEKFMRTSDVLLQDIELLEHRAQQSLSVLVHDKDLPSRRRVDSAYRVQEFCKAPLSPFSKLKEVSSMNLAKDAHCFGR